MKELTKEQEIAIAKKNLKESQNTLQLATLGAVELLKRADEKEVKDIVASLDDCKKSMLYYRDVLKNMQEDEDGTNI